MLTAIFKHLKSQGSNYLDTIYEYACESGLDDLTLAIEMYWEHKKNALTIEEYSAVQENQLKNNLEIR